MGNKVGRWLLLALWVASFDFLARPLRVEAQSSLQHPGAPARDERERRIREDLIKLNFGEDDSDKNLHRLSKYPRSQVLQILKAELAASLEPPIWVLRGMLAVESVELLSDLIAKLEKAERYLPFMVAHELAALKPNGLKDDDRDRLVRLDHEALPRLQPESQEAVIDGLSRLGQPLSATRFRELLAVDSHAVRLALVRNFLGTRSALESAEERNRWRLVIDMKPVQARRLVYEALSDLSIPDRSQLGLTIPRAQCEKEKQPEDKKICLTLVTLKKEGK